MHSRRLHGFTLIETLVVMAIIAILMALYLPVLSKAMRKAEEVAVKEGLRQKHLGQMADNANSVRPSPGPPPTREMCRAAYRQKVNDVIATEMLYVVQDEDEFAAYWYTIINPAESGPLTFSPTGNVIVEDEFGNEYQLPPVDVFLERAPIFPMAWEYISTDLYDTSSGTLGTNVLYSDGHVVYVRYPGEYPVTQLVAELSHRFVAES